jgi:hypothetical protein
MTSNATSLEAAHASVRALIGEKLKYLVPMTVVFMTCYVGLSRMPMARSRRATTAP